MRDLCTPSRNTAGALKFSTLRAIDVLAMNRLKRVTLGFQAEYDLKEAEGLAAETCAWAVRRGDDLIACFGIYEQFPGTHGVGWAMLAEGVGASHLALTRFIRAQAENCGLARLDLLARVPDEIEAVLAGRNDLEAGQVAAIVATMPSPEYRWAVLLGFRPMHLLRCYGPLAQPHMLFERVDTAVAYRQRLAA